jgi:hypothetical protein
MKKQRGAALILFITVLVLGVAWYAIGALGKAAPTSAEREIKTGVALQAGKQALIAYIVQYAARSDTAEPGQLPCPESVTLANPGEASTSCSNATATVGRLPWKTLGIEPLRDGDGEPLWYVLSPGFRSPPINFAKVGQLIYNGAANSAVALIIAPGRAMNTLSAGAPPAGCANVNQQVATRNTASLDLANFLECGNATGSYVNLGSSQWTNDRVISITAAEWADAIAPAVADRLQRQVAPALEEWRASRSPASWGQQFLPYASTFSGGGGPSANDLCGDLNVIEGMPPSATVASAQCDTAWSGGTAGGLGALLSFDGCIPGTSEMRCSFTVVLGGIAAPTVTATAPRIARSFREFDQTQISIRVNGGAPQAGSVSGYAAAVSAASGDATISFQITFPLLSVADTVEVSIPNPSDFLLADARTAWFITNAWDRFTYYAVSRSATANPMASVCSTAGDPGCLTVNGMPAPANDKRLVLAIMGRALLPAQTRPSAAESDYLEQQNASTADAVFDHLAVGSTFNDRLAVCPLRYLDQGGASITICN